MSLFGAGGTFEDDLLLIAADDPRTASYYRRGGADSYAAAVAVTGVVRTLIRAGTLSAGGAVLPDGSVAYHLQAEQLSYSRPWPGDRIVEGSAGYVIDSVSVADEGSRYRCECVPEV